MKAALWGILLSAMLVSVAAGQNATDSNEGSRLEIDGANGIYRFKWWGRAGNTYFIQHSEDLTVWNWVPEVISGGDSVDDHEWAFTTSGTKFFVRLKYTDIPTTNPEGDDFDGDGIGNLWEVQHGQNPFSLESDGDGMSDAYEFAYGLNGAADDRAGDADGDGIPNGEDARPADNTIGRIAVSIDTPQNGSSLP